jgi:thioredoxin-related protein
MNLFKSLVTAAFYASTAILATAGGANWLTDFEAAKKAAAEGKQDMLLDFTGTDWCSWCIKLREEVFDKEAFQAGTKDKYVLVELDFPRKKELDEKLKAQNESLREKFQVEGYPSIFLCDATGKPFAKTGYQQGGPEAYLKHLEELTQAKTKRDAAFEAAAKATDDKEKAKHLVTGLQAMDEELVDAAYGDVIEEIAKLDKEDTAGFTKARLAAKAAKEAEAKSQGLIQKFVMTKLQPAMQKKDFATAQTDWDEFLKANPDLPDEFKAGISLTIPVSKAREEGNMDAAMAALEKVCKEFPESALAKNREKVEQSIKRNFEGANKPKTAEQPKAKSEPVEVK